MRRSARERLATPDGADQALETLIGELRESGKAGPALKRIKERVCSERDPRVRAVYLCGAGNVLKNTVSRRATAVRYYKAALAADPACREARLGLREVLLAGRRGAALEQVYWRLLSRLDPDEDGVETTREVWAELVEILEGRRSARLRSAALRRLLALAEPCIEEPGEG